MVRNLCTNKKKHNTLYLGVLLGIPKTSFFVVPKNTDFSAYSSGYFWFYNKVTVISIHETFQIGEFSFLKNVVFKHLNTLFVYKTCDLRVLQAVDVVARCLFNMLFQTDNGANKLKKKFKEGLLEDDIFF